MGQQKSRIEVDTISAKQFGAEQDLRATVDEFLEAIRAGDLDKVMSFYSDDVIAYDMMPPLRFTDKKAYQDMAWKKYFTDAFQFPIEFEYIDPRFNVQGDTAIVYGLVHINAVFKTGKESGRRSDNWVRNTMYLKCTNYQWKIVHEDNSVAFNDSLKTMMDLQPEDPVH